jgi:N-glycosylase/DNA lyase
VTPTTPAVAEVALVGAGGEPVDLWRTFVSHGLASLPPMALDHDGGALEVTLPLGPTRARTVVIEPAGAATVGIEPAGVAMARVVLHGGRLRAGEVEEVHAAIRRLLALDDDLSSFYALLAGDRDLAWAATGAGRLLRSPTVFEDVVKTLCTTNCAWGATRRMVGALVEHLGQRAPGAPATGPRGRAFPTPEAMAGAGEEFYRDIARAGYRGRYLLELSRSVAEGSVDLEILRDSGRHGVDDDEAAGRLQALAGVGPYAASHVMTLLGRYSRLVLDSWTRPKYARLVGSETVADAGIARRFARYGRWAGLAFWLFLTADWAPIPQGEG